MFILQTMLALLIVYAAFVIIDVDRDYESNIFISEPKLIWELEMRNLNITHCLLPKLEDNKKKRSTT